MGGFRAEVSDQLMETIYVACMVLALPSGQHKQLQQSPLAHSDKNWPCGQQGAERREKRRKK